MGMIIPYIMEKKAMFETTNQSIYTERYVSPHINGSQIDL
jgi:hypothetical protein